MAERLGMTAFELMDRMTVRELMLWSENDRAKAEAEANNPSKFDYQFALFMAKFDAFCGIKNPDPKKYLPKPVKPQKRKKTSAEWKAMLAIVAAQSGGFQDGGA